MAVTLTSAGVTFNDSTTLNSIYNGGFAQSARSLMFRSSAPTGWSQITTHNNKAFRVVSGTGAGSGGSNGFTSAFASRNVSGNAPVSTSFNVGNTTLSNNQMEQSLPPIWWWWKRYSMEQLDLLHHNNAKRDCTRWT